MSTPRRTVHDTLAGLERGRRRKLKERAFATVLFTLTAVAILVLALLVVDIVLDGFTRINVDFLTRYASRTAENTGIRAGLTGTLSLMVLTALVAFPVGVGAAIYLEEFAPDNRFTRLMEANISNLAGVPSVVYGLLGVAVFVYALNLGRSLLAGALTLALLILPVIIVAGRESIRAVPLAIRDGGLALGATPWQVSYRQILPSALPGMLTGTILALSRAIGETAPILVVGAVFSRRADNEPWYFMEAFAALPVQIYNFVSRPQEGFKIDAASAGILVLMAVLLIMNSAAIVARNRFSRRY
ncbi:MAG: phosphate ABC transporter permease PstA [Nitriliruptorales bacterium]|nr:phosphate ABC transporter permease PstA [Nitriliruptorales bacterium]